MNKIVVVAAFCAAIVLSPAFAAPPTALVIHGGAGTISRAKLTPEREQIIRDTLNRALDAGQAVLAAGGPALDAVAAAVVVLEDSPYFNAGKGAVFNSDGINELDSAIMDGATQRAGAIAGVHRVRNPVLLARAVMEQSPHVMLVGDGAEAFATGIGMALVEPSYFYTEERRQQLQDAKKRSSAQIALPRRYYFGTVGAVALDGSGHIAAATSTGGMTNKRWGRVGDAPIIGAGTWADAGCGVSATGWGEFFIRLNVAADICARITYRGDTLTDAANAVVMQRLPELGGDGGVIAMDGKGNIAMPFNTSGMYRAWIAADGSRGSAIYARP